MPPTRSWSRPPTSSSKPDTPSGSAASSERPINSCNTRFFLCMSGSKASSITPVGLCSCCYLCFSLRLQRRKSLLLTHHTARQPTASSIGLPSTKTFDRLVTCGVSSPLPPQVSVPSPRKRLCVSSVCLHCFYSIYLLPLALFACNSLVVQSPCCCCFVLAVAVSRLGTVDWCLLRANHCVDCRRCRKPPNESPSCLPFTSGQGKDYSQHGSRAHSPCALQIR